MTSMPQNINAEHRTIKTTPDDVKSSAYLDLDKEINEKCLKFKVGDHVRISTYKNTFTRGYVPNCSEEVFMI